MAEKNWNKMIGLRLDPKTLYLVELARKVKQNEFDTQTDYVKWALGVSFEKIKIEDDREGLDGRIVPGKTLAELAEKLYRGTEATRFWTLVSVAPWLVSDGESKLLRILQHSDYFAPLSNGTRTVHFGRIQEHWTVLSAIRDGEADIDILPADQRPSAALAFGLKDEAERVSLYKSDPAKYKREREAYEKAMKAKVK